MTLQFVPLVLRYSSGTEISLKRLIIEISINRDRVVATALPTCYKKKHKKDLLLDNTLQRRGAKRTCSPQRIWNWLKTVKTIIFGTPQSRFTAPKSCLKLAQKQWKRSFSGPLNPGLPPLSRVWNWSKNSDFWEFRSFRSKHHGATARSPPCCPVAICHKFVNNNRQQQQTDMDLSGPTRRGRKMRFAQLHSYTREMVFHFGCGSNAVVRFRKKKKRR